MRKKLLLILAYMMLGWSVTSVQAANNGPLIANNIMGGAGAGTIVGLSAGIMSYGFENHRDPKILLTSSVYGFLIGAVTGTGIGFYEISNNSQGTGFTLSEYVIGGTGIGALLGIVVAIIPFTDNGQLENFTIGAGIGGLIGSAAGLSFAILDIQKNEGKGDVLLSGEIGLYPEVIALSAPYQNELKTNREPLLSCRLAQFRF